MATQQKDTRFVRGFFNKGQYGYKVKIHKDAIKEINEGRWTPVGDYYNVEIKEKKDGTGFYMKEDYWTPDQKVTPKLPSQPKINANGTTDDLPF